MPEQKWNELHEYARTRLRSEALGLLDSSDPQERKTGALICGQEKLTEAIPKLQFLLGDRSWFTQGSGGSQTIVFYVRQSAKQALEAMGETVAGVVTQLPVEGHLKYDQSQGRYVVVGENEVNQARPDQSPPTSKP
jgi:hypothetical protein